MASKGGSWKSGSFAPANKQAVPDSSAKNNIAPTNGLSKKAKAPKNEVKPFERPSRKRLLLSLKQELARLKAPAYQFAAERSRRENAKKLDRVLKGQVDRTSARIAALNKQIFETLNPRKVIRVPRGTTQQEYTKIIDRLTAGDKQAIKQYTVPKPKGYRTAGDRKLAKQRKKRQ